MDDILALLAPGTGQNFLWSVFLYLIFFFGLLTLFLIPDKNMVPTILMGLVLVAAAVAKISLAQRRNPILDPGSFEMFVINVVMFVFPLVTIGMTRAKKNRSGAPAGVTALLAGLYFIVFYLFAQR